MYTNIGIALAVLVVGLLAFTIGVISYVMTSLSLYTIADRRKITNPWLAWIPVANYWIVGNIADDYDERNGIKRRWRVTLLVLYIIFMAIFLVGYMGMIVGAVLYVLRAGYGAMEMMPEIMPSVVVGVYGFLMLMSLLSIAVSVCYYICIFKIFESTVPKKAVGYLLISLLVPFGYPICLMSCRKKGYSKEDMPTMPIAPTPEEGYSNEGNDFEIEEQ